MARPALSGSRALTIIDIMAGAPEQAFTLSDLVRATHSNFASCHAVLTVLVSHAYLVRDDAQKTYRLGPALFAAGQAMQTHDRLLKALLTATETLSTGTGLSVAISARAGGELVGVARRDGSRLISHGLRVGQRIALKPPVGATLMAWSDDADIERWIDRGGLPPESAEAASLRSELAAIRQRGYLATLSTDNYATLSSAVAQRNRGDAWMEREGRLISGLFGGLFQPEIIDAHAYYDLAYIGAPVFDSSGAPLYSLTISGFGGRITGEAIEGYAAELTRMCTDVMRTSAGK